MENEGRTVYGAGVGGLHRGNDSGDIWRRRCSHAVSRPIMITMARLGERWILRERERSASTPAYEPGQRSGRRRRDGTKRATQLAIHRDDFPDRRYNDPDDRPKGRGDLPQEGHGGFGGISSAMQNPEY